MSKTLVVVESPSKVKKIQSYLGDNYIVTSSMGHFRGLDPKKMSIDIQNNYTPEFIDISGKKDVISNLKKLYKTCNGVLLASDGDHEGAAIAHHVFELLKVKPEHRKRIIFNEITQKAITEAVIKQDLINMNEVHTQFGRMCLDKLIGYSISPLLWKEFSNFYLGCGRVMSPIIKLIIERENDITKFQSSSYFKLNADFVLDKKHLSISKLNNKSINKSNTLNNNRLNNNTNIINTTCDEDIKDKYIIEKLYKDIKEDKAIFNIKSLTKNNSTRSPPPPFITSSLQQSASITLGMSPDTTMKVAQKLYEASAITYMRSDSTAIAEDAMKSIKTQIESKFGDTYYKKTIYKTKSTSAQQAHECIRPVDFTKESVLNMDGLTSQHNRLYQLIWRRTLACQMTPATLEIRTIKISTESNDNSKKKEQLVFIGKHEKVIFEGFLKAQNYHKKTQKKLDTDEVENSTGDEEDETNDNNDNDNNNNDDEDDENDKDNENKEIKTANTEHNKYLETMYDTLKKGDPAFVKMMNCNEKYSKPKQSRYTEASLISAMEKLGIGRPSTYSSVIRKIQDKDYVEKKNLPPKKVKLTTLNYTYPDIIKIETKDGKVEGDKNKLIPTSLGIMINEYLITNFTDLMDYNYTATIESLLDDIAEGKQEWHKVVDTVYLKLTPIINTLMEALKSRKTLKSADPKADSESRRSLGVNPQNNIPIVAIKSKNGFLIIEENPDKKLARFASFTSSFEKMTLDKALSLLIYPKNLGLYKGNDIIIKKAKNIYISYNNSNYSIENYMKANKNCIIEPETITLEEAQSILNYYEQAKINKAENDKKDIKLNTDIIIKVGYYGPYIKYKGDQNIPLPKKLKDIYETITLEQALEVIEKNKDKPKRGGGGRNKSASNASSASSAKLKKETKPKKKKETKPKKEKIEKEIKPKKIQIKKK